MQRNFAHGGPRKTGDTVADMTAQMVPNPRELRRYVEAGMTDQEIADQWEIDSHVRVTRTAIAMARARYGIPPAFRKGQSARMIRRSEV